MLSAHMDEVGFMVTWITSEGYLKFDTVGGIDERVLCGRNITVGEGENRLNGIISSKAIHHKPRDKRLDITPIEDMMIDVGATDKEDAQKRVHIGDYATFASEFYTFGKDDEWIKSKALDDRFGCMVLIELLRELSVSRPANMPQLFFCFTVREEIGLSGAQVVAQTIAPDFAIVIETTAIADLPEVKSAKQVAHTGQGGAISLMDRSTIYDRTLIEHALSLAKEKDIPAQIKQYVSGGNDSAHIHKSGKGVRTMAISLPTRYLHSPSCVANRKDCDAIHKLLFALLTEEDWDNLMKKG